MRKRKLKRKTSIKQNKIIVSSITIIFLFLTLGYATFQTNINVNVKANIKDFDNEVVKDNLIFWGQYNNKDNTNNIIKDKSGNNNDLTLYGATKTDDGIYFDGVDDYGIISNINYNSNAFTVELIAKLDTKNQISIIFENSNSWNSYQGGFGIATNETGFDETQDDNLQLTVHFEGYNIKTTSNNIIDHENFTNYTISFDTKKSYNNFSEIYLNSISKQLTVPKRGKNELSLDFSNNTFTNYPFYIASRNGTSYFSKMTMKELKIYKKALTTSEINKNYNTNKKRYHLN